MHRLDFVSFQFKSLTLKLILNFSTRQCHILRRIIIMTMRCSVECWTFNVVMLCCPDTQVTGCNEKHLSDSQVPMQITCRFYKRVCKYYDVHGEETCGKYVNEFFGVFQSSLRLEQHFYPYLFLYHRTWCELTNLLVSNPCSRTRVEESVRKDIFKVILSKLLFRTSLYFLCWVENKDNV